MADECKRYDVAIVGSGVAGALIAKFLATRGKKVVILEAGAKIPPNINAYMQKITELFAPLTDLITVSMDTRLFFGSGEKNTRTVVLPTLTG